MVIFIRPVKIISIKKYSASGNRTPVSRVTGGDTHHYTNVELFIPFSLPLYEDFLMPKNALTRLLTSRMILRSFKVNWKVIVYLSKKSLIVLDQDHYPGVDA